jgi:Domain of unknown function (DUF4270)
MSSCEKTPIQFGQSYVDNSFSNIVLVDTFSTQLSTVFYDSIPTTGSGTILAGNYDDPVFGKISASSFFELSPPANSQTIAANAVFDSLKLILIPNKSYYGDTTIPLQLSVYQIRNQIIFPLYQSQFYNTTDFPVNQDPLGSVNTLYYPNITDTLFIRLADTTGQSLFNMIVNNDYIIQSTNYFLPYFSGLKITPTGNNNMNAIFGFKDSTTMRLYYHYTDAFVENKFIDFKFYNVDNTQFNQVRDDRTGTPVAGFNSNNPTLTSEVPSSVTGNTVFLQYLTGFVPKIRFPSIRDLLLRIDYAQILKAQLVISPVLNSFSPTMDLPPSLLAYTTDQNDLFQSPLLSPSGTGYQSGNLVEDYLYNQNTTYTYDVTSYLQQQIAIGYYNQNGLLLSPLSPGNISSFNRAVFGDMYNPKGSIQLKLYYVSVNP